MPAGDIPEVENEINIVTMAAVADWRRTGSQGLADMLEELEKERQAEDSSDRRQIAAAVAASLILFSRRIESPPSKRFKRAARSSARRLIVLGARTSGVSNSRLKMRGPTITKAAREAGDALVFLSRARAQAPRFSANVEAGAREIAKNNQLLAEAERDNQATKEQQQVAAEKTKKAQERLDQAKSKSKTADDRELKKLNELEKSIEKARAEADKLDRKQKEINRRKGIYFSKRRQAAAKLRKTIEDRTGAMSQVISDAWAYRAFNLGTFLAAKSARIEELVAVNPDDNRTTEFCRWVNGRVIRTRQIEKNVGQFIRAAKNRDRDGVIEAWPFISQSKSALQELKEKHGGKIENGFRAFFMRLGLPPYHWRCRTRVFPRFNVIRFRDAG